MTAFVAWILFPLVLGLLALGCGLLLQAASGIKLAEGLLMPAGIVLIIVVAELMTKVSSLAPVTTPLVVVLALVGFALARPWVVRPRIPWWPILTAVGVYFIYLAPVLFSGNPTFTGFIKLDDTATWMGMTDQVLRTGHDISSLAPSTYEAMLSAYLTGGEPVGAMLPWGIGHQIVGQDLAWLFQPYMAFLAAMISMTAWAIARPFIRSRALLAGVAFIAALAALTYGYTLWGGIKEVAAALTLLVSVACVVPIVESRASIRSFLPLAAATFAMLGIDGYGGLVWLPLTLLVAGLVALWLWYRARAWLHLAALGVVGVVLVVLLGIHGGNVASSENAGLNSSQQLGNLAHPVKALQLFGVWPAADFRVAPPNAAGITYLLIALVIAGLALAVLIAFWERAWIVPLCVASAAIGAAIVSAASSPWVQGKAFATASPTLLLVGLIGGAALAENPRRLWGGAKRSPRNGLPREEAVARGDGIMVGRGLALAACVAVGVGVIWSNALQYGHVTLAPFNQFSELSYIGQRFAGQGPTMINQNNPYAGRHFLRLMDPESPSDIRRRGIYLRDGSYVPSGGYEDLDSFQMASLLVYRTIVTRTGPLASRPPAPYRLIYNGKWFQVWQRPDVLTHQIVDSIPLGTNLSPIAVPSCPQVAHLAQEAGANGQLAAAQRTAPTGTDIPSTLKTGLTTQTFNAAHSGRFDFWLGGSVTGHLTTTVDGHQIGSTHQILNEPGGFIPLGRTHLTAGAHHFAFNYTTGGLAPGSAGPSEADPPFTVGPLVAAPPQGEVPVTYVSPANYRSLCGRAWDWVEAIR